MAEQSIGFPQLILIFLLGGITIRYFFFSPGLSTSTTRSSNNDGDLGFREADVERVEQMFPQVPRRKIMWDLQRNGGNVAATIERILSGRALENPPQSFQPSPPAITLQSTSESSTLSRLPPSQPDLITRYDLKAKIAERKQASIQTGDLAAQQSSDAIQKQGQVWSTSKAERQALLQKRREEMILSARQKMEAKIAAEALASKAC